METDLMSRLFELRKLPESLSADFPIYKILNVVEYRIIRHWAFHNIVFM